MNEYYKNCAAAKPTATQKKKKTNGYKNKQYRRCYFCDRNYAERHELFGGSLRQTSINNGFQIDLCREHHDLMHKREGKWNDEVMKLRAACQREYERKLVQTGITEKQAREVWMKLMGKNWL